ncbi:MAG: DinB family protein [Balneolales bacterium]
MFVELFEYNAKSNEELIFCFQDQSTKLIEKSLSLLNHIVNAHQIWLARILGHSPVGVWDIRNLSDVEVLDKKNHLLTFELLDAVELKKLILYSNSAGSVYSNTIEDILFHIINHSTYHRGQIAMEFRGAGIGPLVTDYIFYRRREQV